MGERFWAKVDKSGDCWLWTGAKSSAGYGSFRVGRGGVGAHRIAYELAVGPIPAGLELDHLCRVRHCVNPNHMEPVSHSENTHRGETVAASNAAKTHCPQGHEYTDENVRRGRLMKYGYRQCRICHNNWKASR